PGGEIVRLRHPGHLFHPPGELLRHARGAALALLRASERLRVHPRRPPMRRRLRANLPLLPRQLAELAEEFRPLLLVAALRLPPVDDQQLVLRRLPVVRSRDVVEIERLDAVADRISRPGAEVRDLPEVLQLEVAHPAPALPRRQR